MVSCLFALQTHLKKFWYLSMVNSNNNAHVVMQVTLENFAVPGEPVWQEWKLPYNYEQGELVKIAYVMNRCKRPVRMLLEQNEDSRSSGSRHPLLYKYKVMMFHLQDTSEHTCCIQDHLWWWLFCLLISLFQHQVVTKFYDLCRIHKTITIVQM